MKVSPEAQVAPKGANRQHVLPTYLILDEAVCGLLKRLDCPEAAVKNDGCHFWHKLPIYYYHCNKSIKPQLLHHLEDLRITSIGLK
jgi:hypothetical protein